MPDEMYRPLRDTMPWKKRAGTPMPLFAAPSRLPHKTRVKGALIQKHQFWLAVWHCLMHPSKTAGPKLPGTPETAVLDAGRGGFLQATLCGCRGNLKKPCAKNAFQGAMASCVNAPKQRALFSFAAKAARKPSGYARVFACHALRAGISLQLCPCRLSGCLANRAVKGHGARQLSLPGPVPPAGKI